MPNRAGRAKLVAIAMGIALSLPLAVYTGVNMITPPPSGDTLVNQDFEQRRADATTKEEKERIAEEQKRQQQKWDAQETAYEKRMFFISFPVGLAAVIAGTLLALPAIGEGLLFGGIFLMVGGSYSYWDKMSNIAHFLLILVALVVFMGLGYRQGQDRSTKG